MHTDKSSKRSASKPKHKENVKQSMDKPAKTDAAKSSDETLKSTEDTTSSPSPVIGEKQPTISEAVAGLPSQYLGTWENHNNGDCFKISNSQLVSGNSISTTTSDISKVGKDHGGYLVQTVDGRSYYFTIIENKLYPLTLQEDLTSDVAKQMMFEKPSK